MKYKTEQILWNTKEEIKMGDSMFPGVPTTKWYHWIYLWLFKTYSHSDTYKTKVGVLKTATVYYKIVGTTMYVVEEKLTESEAESP